MSEQLQKTQVLMFYPLGKKKNLETQVLMFCPLGKKKLRKTLWGWHPAPFPSEG